jgi:hypothetical protein
MAALKLPAFGRALYAMRMRGERPLGNPFFGDVLVALDCWQWAPPATVHRLVVPPGTEPAALDFTCIHGLHVLVAHDVRRSSAQRIHATLEAVGAAGPCRVSIADMAAPELSTL